VSLDTLGTVLMTEIGGSMGPLYGVMFTEFAETIEGVETIDAAAYSKMLHAGLAGIQSIGSAKVGDKTLLDTFVPAVEAFDAATANGKSFGEALEALVAAAETGRDSTINLVAKIGRASRLGERSLGVLDAGATSCAIILKELSDGARARLA
jgi:dihydroxyacetone kinase-like protein